MTHPVRPVLCVVDDDPGIHETLHFILEDAGYGVEEAEDGEIALRLLHRIVRPRVLLLDRVMRRLDGAQLLCQFGTASADVVRNTMIICMTARSDPPAPEVAWLMRQYTFASFAKPFDLELLLSTVEQASNRLLERIAAR